MCGQGNSALSQCVIFSENHSRIARGTSGVIATRQMDPLPSGTIGLLKE